MNLLRMIPIHKRIRKYFSCENFLSPGFSGFPGKIFFFLHFQAVDWWSVGVLTYELLTGASPFTVEGEKNTQQEISR